jgi:hypothetical protein
VGGIEILTYHAHHSTTAVPGRPLWAKLSIAVCLGLAAYWGLQSLNATAGPSKTTTAVKKKLHATPIEKIAVGHRVLGQNPEVSDDERAAFDEPNATDWKTLRLRMTKQNGGRLDITLLRPADWIEAVGAKSGSELELDLPEMGAVGRAEVLEIGPCPPIRSGQGNVVTGTFAHESTDVIDLRIASQPAPIGCTSNHRFWSVDRREFLEAGKLRIGEHLDTPNGETTVVSLTPHAQPEPVYNIEVNGEHVYRVGEVGALVHNSYAWLNPKTIRFTQNSIKRTFKNGSTLANAIDGLRSGSISPNSFPPIRVFWKDGKLWTLDNRRLYVFQQAEKKIKTVMATTEEIAREIPRKMHPINDGLNILLRGESL